jgi:hypothetical protein
MRFLLVMLLLAGCAHRIEPLSDQDAEDISEHIYHMRREMRGEENGRNSP